MCREKKIRVTGITKAVMGDPDIARTLVTAGVSSIGDSRIENIERMKKAGVDATFVLIRTPLMSQAEKVVTCADISLNSELDVIRALSGFAGRHGITHKVIIMVEMGDFREGILVDEVDRFVSRVRELPHIEVAGLGTNLACLNGVRPDDRKMAGLSEIAEKVEQSQGMRFSIISGGNSSNFQWVNSSRDVFKINNLRIGELIFLGMDPLAACPVDFLRQDAFSLVSEVIESKRKKVCLDRGDSRNAFGEISRVKETSCEGMRTILGIGRQDALISGLVPLGDYQIMGSSSDHLVVSGRTNNLKVGQEVRFALTYGALLTAYTSPFVRKTILNLT